MSAYFSKIDLHCHSSASDGALSPAALISRALDKGLTHIALTDHDCILGLEEAEKAAAGHLTFINGVELSSLWRDNQIHVVGLYIDRKKQALLTYLEMVRNLREQRAMEIGYRLEKQGFKDAYSECCAQAKAGASITRGNYARYIVSKGRAQSADEAFNIYLKKGRSCYVKTVWPALMEVVKIILESDGIPILAHPKRYDFTNTKLKELLSDFKECGGMGMEVSSCQMKPSEREYLTKLCFDFGFLASIGSDFHYVGQYLELGYNLIIDPLLPKVWEHRQHKGPKN